MNENDQPNPDAERLKSTRSRVAGWLTRILKPCEDDTLSKSPVVLKALEDRISSQVTKLQKCHDQYIEKLTDGDEIDRAEEWVDHYFKPEHRRAVLTLICCAFLEKGLKRDNLCFIN